MIENLQENKNAIATEVQPTGKVYGYIRVSTDKQTLENQRFEINKYCTKKAIHIDRWYEEHVSGTIDTKDRKIGELLKVLKEGDTIVIAEISRLGRSLYMIMSIFNILEKKKVNLYSIKENFTLVANSITTKMAVIVFGIAAEIERTLISQRTKEALAMRKKNGMKLGRPEGSKNRNHRLAKHHDRIMNYIHRKRTRYYICNHLHSNTTTVNTYLRLIKGEIPEHLHEFYGII